MEIRLPFQVTDFQLMNWTRNLIFFKTEWNDYLATLYFYQPLQNDQLHYESMDVDGPSPKSIHFLFDFIELYDSLIWTSDWDCKLL